MQCASIAFFLAGMGREVLTNRIAVAVSRVEALGVLFCVLSIRRQRKRATKKDLTRKEEEK